MSGGQHRDDEANGPSRSGEREAEGRRTRECNQLIAAALISGCAQENKKLRQNVLDGADFVRDVIDIYLYADLRQTQSTDIFYAAGRSA